MSSCRSTSMSSTPDWLREPGRPSRAASTRGRSSTQCDACLGTCNVLGADIVEVSPPYDGPGEQTAYLANRIVMEILNGMAERKVAG